MTQDNTVIFPKIQKYTGNVSSEMSEEDVAELTFHYAKQIANAFQNHGIPTDGFFLQDMEFAHNVLIATVMRANGKHHPLQELIDDLMEPDDDEDYDEDEDSEEGC